MLLYGERNYYIIPWAQITHLGKKSHTMNEGQEQIHRHRYLFFYFLTSEREILFFNKTMCFEISSFRESYLACKLYDLNSTEFSHYKKNITKCILIFKEIWDTDFKIKQVKRIPLPVRRQERGLVTVLAPFAGKCEPTS